MPNKTSNQIRGPLKYVAVRRLLLFGGKAHDQWMESGVQLGEKIYRPFYISFS